MIVRTLKHENFGKSIHVRLRPETTDLFIAKSEETSMSLSSVIRLFIEQMLLQHKEFTFGYKEETHKETQGQKKNNKVKTIKGKARS